MQRLGMDQPVDGLPAGNDGGERHDGDDEEPGQVFGPAEAIGVTPGHGPAGEDERDPQRHRCQGIGEVVDGVGEQRYRTADEHHCELKDRGAEQHEKADLDRPDTLDTGLEHAVNGVRRVLRVRNEQPVEKPFDPGRMLVGMPSWPCP
jgi:hypothetical protein